MLPGESNQTLRRNMNYRGRQ